MRQAFLAVLVLGGAGEEPAVWVFFSPDSPDARRIFEELRGRPVRPVLLVERYATGREPSEAFLASVKAAGTEILVVDEEGLREARRLGIRELPAVAFTLGGRTHVTAGSLADLKEVLGCSR